ncbi:hypothetical protein EVJ58_g1858 [Rhodofomes roseus]|uniref:Uncharacterized protein n=1 Tax=Rhodofomes roseus TaxID=34475 RepID=A0A4Y9YXF7_9APHY|nr:hypothetical protein EVJ58_g1858 [Rhodofomes roseus]
MSVAAHAREHTPEGAPSPPLQSHAPQVLPPHLIPLPPPGPSHSQSLPAVPQVAQNPHHPRPINRVPPPNFLSQFGNDTWQMTPELIAEIERADLQQAAGQSGFAYAGGAASSNLSLVQPAKDPAVERVRASDRSSPKDQDAITAKRQSRDKDSMNARDSPKTRDRSQTVSSISSMEGHAAVARTPEYRGSPQFQAPMVSPGERTAVYTQYVPEGYRDQGGNTQVQGPTPPTRKPVPAVGTAEAAPTRLTPPATSKLVSSHTPPLQTMTSRPSERSLPLQEEPEEEVTHYVDREPEYEDLHRGSPTPSSDLYPEGRYEPRREHARHPSRGSDDEEDDVTLNDEDDDHQQMQGKDGEDSGSGSGFTPRSPTVPLPDRSRDAPYTSPTSQYGSTTAQYSSTPAQYQANTNADYQKTIRAKHRSGPTDQLGMRSFDPTMFEGTVNSLRSNDRGSPAGGQRQSSRPPQPPPQPQPQQQPTAQAQQTQVRLDSSRVQADAAQHAALGQLTEHQLAQAGIYPPRFPHPDELQSLLEDPTSSYIHSFLRTPGARPNAPIPPTPQSNTAAPSPSPLLSAMHSDAEPRQIGSPYPYPFTHIRRSTMPAMQQAPSSTPDMNNLDYVREQMALQMQIYALNNGYQQASDASTFSPPATPFPGPGYNPLAFVPLMGMQGLGQAGARASVMSMRSSPSHEPPRETSPELSSDGSGEETAGEEKFVDHYIGEASAQSTTSATPWTNGNGIEHVEDEEGEWVDEEEEGEEEDLLELEYHPTYVSSVQRRRRRWETRWDALIQAFQALDRETDATLVMLASPSHSTKLHALTSRSIRRDAALYNSPKLANIRASFNHLASHRRNARSQRMSLVERLHLSAGSAASADGSPITAESREADLRRALEAALGSLSEMGKIYEGREMRWHDEMKQLTDDRDRVELLLKQALGPLIPNGNVNGDGRS